MIEEPYDSLSFVPTVLALTGNLRDDNNPIPVLWDKGFRHFPGRLVKEVLARPEAKPKNRGYRERLQLLDDFRKSVT